MHCLAISGSLRARSLNSAALRLLRSVAPEGVEISLFEALGGLPHFSPDTEGQGSLPTPVASLRSAVSASHGLIIACPEYAHGLPGTFKNALDWLVGCTDFAGKPVMLINTAPRAVHAQAQLREILTTMAAVIVEEACLALSLREGMTEAEIGNPDNAQALREAVRRFILATRANGMR